jgi:hypothetical protein
MTDDNQPPTFAEMDAIADAHEAQQARELDELVIKSILYQSGDVNPVDSAGVVERRAKPGESIYLMREDPRLPKMPAEPTLIDFFRYRFGPAAHLCQSAKLALSKGLDEKTVMACLLHDIAVAGLIRTDHGYWGAQLIEPYVDEEISWAVRMHQALRFYPDEAVGYEYPETYVRFFGENYRPDPYIDRAYQEARNHKWYMTARLVTLNDLYAFDPNTHVDIEEFTDIIGRHFKQPKEGLGNDNSPSSHMWRTIIAPTKFL